MQGTAHPAGRTIPTRPGLKIAGLKRGLHWIDPEGINQKHEHHSLQEYTVAHLHSGKRLKGKKTPDKGHPLIIPAARDQPREFPALREIA